MTERNRDGSAGRSESQRKTQLFDAIRRVTERSDLSSEACTLAFRELEENDLDGFLYFAFLAALQTKGMTSDELLGFCNATASFVPTVETSIPQEGIIDLSGTGGDALKTTNVSTAAAFVVASAGIAVAKQAFLAVTGVTGSADVMRSIGADPLALSGRGPEGVREVFEKTGMVLYHANSLADPKVRKGYYRFWLEHVARVGMPYVTAYHLAANAYSAIPMKRRVYGVFSPAYLRPLAELFQKLGYSRGLVCHGVDGLDEVSNTGDTVIAEFTASEVKEYFVTPEELGLRRANPREIVSGDAQGNVRDFLRILYGVDKSAKRDLVLANAGAGLFVMGDVPSLRDGVERSRDLIASGKVAERLEGYIAACGDREMLRSAREAAGVD